MNSWTRAAFEPGKEVIHNDTTVNLSYGISGTATIPLAATDHTLTLGTSGEAQAFVLILTGTLTANVNLIVPAESRVYVVDNRTTGAFTVTCRPAAGGGVAVDQSARTLIYCDGSNVYPVASGTGGGGGGSGAPTDASYLVGASHTLLSGERVVTDTATVTWDVATAGQAKAAIPPDAVTYAHLQPVTSSRLLGRFTAGAGDVQEITPGTGLSLDSGTGVLSATAVGQPLDATLTALAGLATGANQLPYSTGTDTFSQTPLTAFARTVLDDADAATMRGTLSVQASDATLTALAGVTTGADTLPFFTGTDTASTTTLTAFMRGLLDDPDLATAQTTLGITGGGGGSTDFLGLTDTPDTYSGQASTFVRVNAAATALEFVAQDPELAALSVLVSTADRVPYYTGSGTAALATFTAAGRTLAGAADAAAQRTALALGTMAQQNANAVAITGGVATLGGAGEGLAQLSVRSDVVSTDIANLLVPLRLYPHATIPGGLVRGLRIEGPAVTGAGTIGQYFGVQVQDVVAPVTNEVYGVYANISSGTNRWGFFQQGSAASYMGGTLQVVGHVGLNCVPNVAVKLEIQYPRDTQHGIKIRPTVNDTGSGNAILLVNVANTTVGSITTTAAATAYNTSSDARLKHAITALTGALDVLAALRPVAFRWNADDSVGHGFVAHELQATIPDAVTGEPDAVNEDGSVRPQQVDHSRIVPWLTAALQETLAQVQALTARVVSLEEQLGV